MEQIAKILAYILPILFFLILWILCILNKGQREGKIGFLVQIRENRLFRILDYLILFSLWSLSVYFFFECINKSIFQDLFDDSNKIIPYLTLLLKYIITPTWLIALFGPIILASNYKVSKDSYHKMHQSEWGSFIDTRFYHTFDLNALIIGWITFAFQILTNPIFSIQRLNPSIKFYYLQKGITSNFDSSYDGLGESVGQCFQFITHDLLSILFILLAIGFTIWILIRLLTGQLSETRVIELYEGEEKDGRRERKYPLLSSRITLYRYIIALFSFLYLAWAEYYITFNIVKEIDKNCSPINSLPELLQKLSIPENNEFIKLVLFLVFFILTIIVCWHYFVYFKSILLRKKSEK